LNLLANLSTILPELVISTGVLVLLIADLLIRKNRAALLSGLTLLFLSGALALFFLYPASYIQNPVFSVQIHPDSLAYFFRIAVLFAGITAVIYSYKNEEIKNFDVGEYLILVLASVAGAMFLTMSSNIVMVYLSIEFVSILSYILTATRLNKAKALEGAIKYILFGAVSSGVMAFGFSFIYGITGSLDLTELGNRLAGHRDFPERALLLGSLAMVGAGLFYKVAVAPFHAWAPDVYEGASTPVTTFFSIAPKIAGFAMIIRVLMYLMNTEVFFARTEILHAFAVIGVLTMTIGNLSALWQDSLKRMLAYSSIAHAGYITATLAAWGDLAVQGVSLYLAVYLVMNTGAFLVLMAHTKSEDKMLSDFRGFAYRGSESAFWAALMAAFLFSLTGLPPFAGFIAKYYLFAAMVQKELYWVVALAVINTVISLYYYARILKTMYFDKEDHVSEDVAVNWSYKILGLTLAILTVVIGIFPQVISLPKYLVNE
jgi:NADH-quinone oxidoreductase subunit N